VCLTRPVPSLKMILLICRFEHIEQGVAIECAGQQRKKRGKEVMCGCRVPPGLGRRIPRMLRHVWEEVEGGEKENTGRERVS